MSMLSSMCEKMRETAHEVERVKNNNADWLWRDAITLNDAVRELCDAADTIDYLRNTCNDLQRDYENLRRAMWDRANARAIDFMTEDELRGLCTDLYDYVDELKALVRDMWTCVREGEWDCSDCPRYDRCDVGVSEFGYRIRQLGVEVDDDAR